VFAWRRWWSKDGLPALRLMALERWDPLGVYEQPERVDEYDAYLGRVGRLLRRGAGPEELARYLARVRREAMKLEENEDADEAFADEVTTWYALEKP
jgi:hypothetical protein